MTGQGPQGAPARGPLSGIRVIDITTIIMGPYATQILGDFGADVIKVEAPPAGDNLRHVGPCRTKGMGPVFLQLNRNKRSIVLDLKKTAGREILVRLCRTADVVAYNVRPQAMERLGLGYDEIRKENPGVIYAGMFGFGRSGPYAADPAYDDLIQGMSGFPATLGQINDGVPRYFPVNFCDRTTGIFAVSCITTALFHRERTGQGQMIDIPMFETMSQFNLGDNLYGKSFIPPLGPTGYGRIVSSERKPYRTLDGHICVVIYSDKHWERFFSLAGKADLFRSKPEYQTLSRRTPIMDELYRLAASVFATRTSDEWMKVLHDADIPAAPMHTLDTLLEDPHLAATGLFQIVDHPSEGTIRLMRNPSEWSATAPEMRRLPPKLGEHSEEILEELGYDRKTITEFLSSGVSAGDSAKKSDHT